VGIGSGSSPTGSSTRRGLAIEVQGAEVAVTQCVPPPAGSATQGAVDRTRVSHLAARYSAAGPAALSASTPTAMVDASAEIKGSMPSVEPVPA
jgi:hypothetical protein